MSNSPFSSSGISSLLRSAASRAQTIQTFNDKQAADEWNRSAQTYSDYLAYSKYLTEQAAKTTDPMKQLTYSQTIQTAQRSFTSNEIQRQTQMVQEGNQTNRQKYSNITSLYYQALNNGDMNQAQNLRSTLDSLSITIQNEDQTALTAAKSARSDLAKNIDNQLQDAVAQIQDNANYAIKQYEKLGPVKFQKAAGSDLFSMLANMFSSNDPNNPGLAQVYQQAASTTPDPSKVRTYQQDFNKIVEGTSNTFAFKLPGVGNINIQDIQDQAYANSIGQSVFTPVETGQGVQFKRNDITGYAYGRDETGGYKLMPIYGQAQVPESQVSNGKNGVKKYDAVLKDAGFNVTQEGQKITVVNNGELDQAGIPRGEQVQLSVDANGNLQVVNGNEAYSLNFDKTGKYLGIQKTEPNPINLLPGGDLNSQGNNPTYFNNRYFASQGINPDNLVGGAIGLVDTTSPYARFMEPGTLLSRATAIQLQKAQSVQNPAPLPALPAPVPSQPNYNVMNAPANAHISIAQPHPLPNITIARPQPLPRVSVSNQPNTQTLSVDNQPNTQTIGF